MSNPGCSSRDNATAEPPRWGGLRADLASLEFSAELPWTQDQTGPNNATAWHSPPADHTEYRTPSLAWPRSRHSNATNVVSSPLSAAGRRLGRTCRRQADPTDC